MIFYNSDLDDNEIEEIEREKVEEQEEFIQRKYDIAEIFDYKNGNKNGNGKTTKKYYSDQTINKIQNPDLIEYIIKSVKKTVKCEDSLIRQILYTALSSYVEDDPINLGVLAPTSEGKTYAITESLQYFPDEDILYIGQMSPKVLVRQKGILIDKKTGEPIKDKLIELRTKYRDLKKEFRRLSRKKEDMDERENIVDESEKVSDDIRNLIDNSKTHRFKR